MLINLGACELPCLARAQEQSIIGLRTLSALEYAGIKESTQLLRDRIHRDAVELLRASQAAFRATADDFGTTLAPQTLLIAQVQSSAALTSWVLLWRLTLDQWLHGLSTEFGRDSAQFAVVKAATATAYDTFPAYRLVETLRNIVAHEEIVPLKSTQQQSVGQPTIATEITLSDDWLTGHNDCKAVVKNDLAGRAGEDLDVSKLLVDAMAALASVELALRTVQGARFELAKAVVRGMRDEAAPGSPVVVTQMPDSAGGNMTFDRFEDLLFWLAAVSGPHQGVLKILESLCRPNLARCYHERAFGWLWI
jgi:hypothetical protein